MTTYIAIAGTVASVALGSVCLYLLHRVDSYITRLGDVEEALSYETARADRAEAAARRRNAGLESLARREANR